MRVFPIAAALVTVGALAVPAEAATPHPSTCTAVAPGAVVPPNPGGLAATAAVVTYGAEVTCGRNVLTPPPIEHLQPYTGHLSLELRAADGTLLCGGAPTPGAFDSVSSVLVMAKHNVCVVPVSVAARTQSMYVRAYWATMPPYICCSDHRTWITPAGIG